MESVLKTYFLVAIEHAFQQRSDAVVCCRGSLNPCGEEVISCMRRTESVIKVTLAVQAALLVELPGPMR